MSLFSHISTWFTAIGGADNLDHGLNNSGSSTLSNVDLGLQTTAAVTSIEASFDPMMAAVAVSAGEAAMASGTAVLYKDYSSQSSYGWRGV